MDDAAHADSWRKSPLLAARRDFAGLSLAAAYLALADDLIAAGAPALAHFGIAPGVIAADMRARVPAWCVEPA